MYTDVETASIAAMSARALVRHAEVAADARLGEGRVTGELLHRPGHAVHHGAHHPRRDVRHDHGEDRLDDVHDLATAIDEVSEEVK